MMYFSLVVIGGLISFVLAFAIGANDTANSFGTSVGSKVLTLKQAYFLASLFESIGACLLGHQVTDSMRKGIINFESITTRNGTEEKTLIEVIMLGQVAILNGCGMFMIVATALKLPVSTTHSIVGSTLGFAYFVFGRNCFVWKKIGRIFASWIISPFFSGIITAVLYTTIDHLVLRREEPLESGVQILPLIYFLCFSLNVFAILYEGSSFFGFDKLNFEQCVSYSCLIGMIVVIGFLFLAPRLKQHILSTELERNIEIDADQIEMQETLLLNPNPEVVSTSAEAEESESSSENSCWSRFVSFFRSDKPEHEHASRLFSLLQITNACFGAFSHGGNDVSNAIAPLVSLVLLSENGMNSAKMDTPLYLLMFGSIGMCAGLWACGHRVIYTVGEGITKITPASGFTVEFGSALTVMIASKIGVPISSTQCKIGSVVAVGILQSKSKVEKTVIKNIFLSWLVTLPVSGILSAATMAFLNFVWF